jgi:hypothetical protein
VSIKVNHGHTPPRTRQLSFHALLRDKFPAERTEKLQIGAATSQTSMQRRENKLQLNCG